MATKTSKIGVFVVLLIVIGALILYLPIPYTAVEVYTTQEPYIGTEYYQESVPTTLEECKTDISLNPSDYIGRGIDALLTGDQTKLYQTCQEVVRQRIETKSRDVVKYKIVKKERSVTKTATPYMFLTNQVKYYYEV